MGQVFIYIIALVLASLILLYGYKAIFGQEGFIQRAEQIALARFQTEIESQVKETASDYGRVKKLELNVPTRHTKVCIVDSANYNSNSCLCRQSPCEGNPANNPEDYNPIICNAWQGTEQNIFLVPMADIEMITVATEVEHGYVCVPVTGGKVILKAEGLGNRARISPWQQ